MRLSICVLGVVGVALALPASLHAQSPATPEPLVRLSMDRRQVLVGQRATLKLEVFAPNYMTAPPMVPDLQMRNAATYSLGTRNQSEEVGTTTLAGVIFEYAIYPLEPGSYELSGKRVTVTYAAEPPATRKVTLPLPTIAFVAVIPEPAAGLQPFLAAESLALEQTIRQSAQELKPGDAVTRIVTAKGTGVPAMLLPAAPFPPVDGLSTYAAEPSLQNHFDARTDQLSAVRVDQATFMAIRPGAYVLPPIEVTWWDARNSKLARSSIDAVPLKVAAGPAPQNPSVGEPPRGWRIIAFVGENKALSCGVLALLGLVWISRLGGGTATRWLRRQRDAYRTSEASSFRRLRRAARRNNAREVYSALLDWVGRFEPLAPTGTLAALSVRANDRDLDADVAAIERELFGPHVDAEVWSARGLMRRAGRARRRLREQSRSGATRDTLPPNLNPTEATHDLPSHTWRPVAR